MSVLDSIFEVFFFPFSSHGFVFRRARLIAAYALRWCDFGYVKQHFSMDFIHFGASDLSSFLGLRCVENTHILKL